MARDQQVDLSSNLHLGISSVIWDSCGHLGITVGKESWIAGCLPKKKQAFLFVAIIKFAELENAKQDVSLSKKCFEEEP